MSALMLIAGVVCSIIGDNPIITASFILSSGLFYIGERIDDLFENTLQFIEKLYQKSKEKNHEKVFERDCKS